MQVKYSQNHLRVGYYDKLKRMQFRNSKKDYKKSPVTFVCDRYVYI